MVVKMCAEQGRSRRERRSTAGTTKRFADCVIPVTSPRSAAKLKKQPPVKRNAVGETPLHQAAKRGDAARVQQLLRQGADPNVTDHAGQRTVLAFFCIADLGCLSRIRTFSVPDSGSASKNLSILT
jgi:hypothetical protein